MFQTQREYRRSILAPVKINERTPPIRGTTTEATPSSLPGWNSSTHRFVGTDDRASAQAWPATKFEQDPALIPDDSAHNIPYDSQTAVPRLPGDPASAWRVFADDKAARFPLQVPPPWIVAKRFLPENPVQRRSEETMTLLMVPGVGVPKEMMEPILQGILGKQRSGGFAVEEVWLVDMPWGGEAAKLNPVGFLYGNEKDIARDLLLFIAAYLPLNAGKQLPRELKARRPTNERIQTTRRNLHFVGHSLGAQAAMMVAAHAPGLFASLSVIDPAIIPSGKILQAFAAMPKDVLCAGFEWKYESAEALNAALQKNKRTRAWNDGVRKIYIERATERDGELGVRLVAHPRLEWAIYYDQETPTHCYDRLADIQTPLNAVMPARPFAVPPKMLEADIKKLAQKTRITWVANATHQIPYEKVEECAEAIALWLQDFDASHTARL